MAEEFLKEPASASSEAEGEIVVATDMVWCRNDS